MILIGPHRTSKKLNIDLHTFIHPLFSNACIFYKNKLRSDSMIPSPYSKWVYYDPNVRQMEQKQNYAQNKTKKVAWLVSNCGYFVNNNRFEYAEELQKHIQVRFCR